MSTKAVFAGALLVASVAGCGSRNLTRPLAKQLIQTSSAFSPAVVKATMPRQGIDCGIRHGLWARHSSGFLELTPQGEEHFSQILEWPDPGVTYAKPFARKVVEVTGITDSPAFGPAGARKLVQFTYQWNYDDIPAVFRACVAPFAPWKGQAWFQLYDDGWRLERLE